MCTFIQYKALIPFISWLLPGVLVDNNTVSLAHSPLVDNLLTVLWCSVG